MIAPRPDRRTMRRLLVRHGLAGGPRLASDPRPASQRLAAVLTELGPVTALFGAYLAARADLLSAPDRAHLASIEPRPEALDRATLRLQLETALGRPSDVLDSVDPTPESCDGYGQWHRARRTDGTPVRLYWTRPDIHLLVDQGLDTLHALSPTLGRPPFGLPADALVADFRVGWVQPRIDLSRQAEILGRLGRSDRHDLVVPPPVPELCRRAVLAVEDPSGCRGLLTDGPMSSRGPRAARHLCQVWLQLATGEHLVARDLHLGRLEDDRLVWLDGLLTGHAPSFSRRLHDFLRAAASQSPERVADALSPEILAAGADPEQVLSRLRQATPRRWDPRLGETSGADGENAVECALAYWQAAALELPAPWRTALVALENLGRQVAELDPQGDPLADALWRLEWHRGLRRIREMATPAELAAMAQRYSTAFLELPPRLDRWLDQENAAQDRHAAVPPPAPLGLATPLALMAAMVAVMAVVRAFDERSLEALGTLLFAVLGAALLRTLAT